MQKIAVLTSGGDAPGMNAAVRAVVRKAIYHGLEVVGIKRGYTGFVEGDMAPMDRSSVADIIQRGGTVLRTSRCEEFRTELGRAQAFANVERYGLQGLVVIGGDGSFRGAKLFAEEYQLPVIAIPGTIDNDINGTDYSIGFDTAVNTAVDAIDKIRDTATSHERTFVVEVMGRDSGFIALSAGLAGGAETVVIPEYPVDVAAVCKKVVKGFKQGKLHSIIVAAEGAIRGIELAKQIKAQTGFECKPTILGHLLRGGSPTAFDRDLASRMGAKAVELLLSQVSCQMVASVKGDIVGIDFDEAITAKKPVDLELYRLIDILAI
ncbi:MAG: 6-phosphofructokinase [Sporomusaceae bacterium]|nr:6-phosphofructokinase [Sporomusaceae bacterium]